MNAVALTTVVSLTSAARASIVDWAEAAYPREGCGLLIGRFAAAGEKQVVRLAPLKNIAAQSETLASGVNEDRRFSTLPEERRAHGGGTEFVMDPAEFNQATLAAERENLDVVGVIHTHPDHPAMPSKIDASQPFLAQWSNIIVSVEKGRVKDLRSWFRETDSEPFSEETVRVAP